METMQILTNPPSDVQSSVAAVIQACHNWKPTEVPMAPAGKVISPEAPHLSTEAQICGYIQRDPTRDMDQMMFAFYFGSAVGGILIMTIIVSRLHRLPGFIWNSVMNGFRRTTA